MNRENDIPHGETVIDRKFREHVGYLRHRICELEGMNKQYLAALAAVYTGLAAVTEEVASILQECGGESE